MEINPENKLQDPLSEKTLPLFAQKLKISHFSPTQFSLPDAAWLFKYIILTQTQRRELLESNSAMEAGKRVGDILQRMYADTIFKLNPSTRKVAPTTNEKLDFDNALQEQTEIFKEYNAVSDKDVEKKIRYIEELKGTALNADKGLIELGLSHPLTCERQVSLTNSANSGEISYPVSFPSLSVVGRIDFDNGVVHDESHAGKNHVSHDQSFPTKIVELKTKWSRLGRTKKDGSRSFIVSSAPDSPSFNHVVQCAVYAAYWNFKVPIYLLYATDKDYKIFDSVNCKHLTVEGMQKNLQIMNNVFIRREKILSLYQDQDRDGIIENAISLMDGNWDHPWCWNGIPEDLLKDAKEMWKVN